MTETRRRRGLRLAGWWWAACATSLWLASAGAATAACTVSLTSNVAFGAYNVFSSNPLDSVGQFRWHCDTFTFPNVRITLTRGGSTTFQPRRLRSGAALLDYNLYIDAARTRVWGDETEGTQAYYQQYWGFGWISVSVFGRVPGAQDASVGAYSDGVMIVVNY
jgi:spore coat protein U-like protein